MVRTLTSFILGVVIVPSVCSTSRQATPRQPSSTASASPTGPPPTISTGIVEFTGRIPRRVAPALHFDGAVTRTWRSSSGFGRCLEAARDVSVQLIDVFGLEPCTERVIVDTGIQRFRQHQQIAE